MSFLFGFVVLYSFVTWTCCKWGHQ